MIGPLNFRSMLVILFFMINKFVRYDENKMDFFDNVI